MDVINCRLTRLANWREVLERETPQLLDMFETDFEWSERVKAKYQSLKALAMTNPKRALDVQYNKQKVFMEIIDRWMDRLKRHFTYIYKSRGTPPEDFNAPVCRIHFSMCLKFLFIS